MGAGAAPGDVRARRFSQEQREYIDMVGPHFEDSQSTNKAGGGVHGYDEDEEDDSQFYYLTLSIHYETKFGEYLCVTGDIPEMGSWKTFKCRLQWTDGHVWTTPKPIKTKQRII